MLTAVQAFGAKKGGEWSGYHYDKNSWPQYEVALKALLHTNLPVCKRVLDIGCGSGRITNVIADSIPQASVTGIDPSRDMVTFAKKMYAGNKNLSFAVGSAFNIPGAGYDLILSCNALHWEKEQGKAFASIGKKLAPGKPFLLVMSHEYKDHPLWKAFQAIRTKDIWKPYFSNVDMAQQYFPLNKETILKLMQEARLEVKLYKELDQEFKFANTDELKQWLAGWVFGMSKVAGLPEKLKEPFMIDLVKSYAKQVGAKEDEPIGYLLPSMIVIAVSKG